MRDTETYNNDCIECPDCGHKERDGLYDYDEDSCNWTCGSCGKDFRLSVHASMVYTVNRDCELQGEKHDWIIKPKDNDGWIYSSCKKCSEAKAHNPARFPNAK